MMAALYGVDVRTISDHIKKIYLDSELEESATIRKFRIVQTEGSRQVQRETKDYDRYLLELEKIQRSKKYKKHWHLSKKSGI